MKEKLIRLMATGFGAGYVPLAPGTAGTLLAVPLYLACAGMRWPLYALFLVVLSGLACWISGEAEKVIGEKDASIIVIDEIAGFPWAMFLINPTVLTVALGFVFFRFFDIAKLFPADLVHKRLPGGYGIVADDIMAGIYSNIALHLMVNTFGI